MRVKTKDSLNTQYFMIFLILDFPCHIWEIICPNFIWEFQTGFVAIYPVPIISIVCHIFRHSGYIRWKIGVKRNCAHWKCPNPINPENAHITNEKRKDYVLRKNFSCYSNIDFDGWSVANIMKQCTTLIYEWAKGKYCGQPRGGKRRALFTLIVHYTKFQSMIMF